MLKQQANPSAFSRPVQRIYRLCASIRTSVLLKAFNHVISSHPALRLRLSEDKDGWWQYFSDHLPEITGVSIIGKTPNLRASYASYIISQDASVPFDLCNNSPILAKVVTLDGEYYLSLCLDHIAADDLATDLFEHELSNAYARELLNLPHPTSQAENLFFAYMERENSQRFREEYNLNYWITLLRNAPLSPKDGNELSWKPGMHQRWVINESQFKVLNQACRIQQCSLFTLVLAALTRLIGELGNNDDVIINIPISNRALPSDYSLIANLSMLLHLRINGALTSPPSAFLVHVRDKVLGGMVHRQYDYDALSNAMIEDAASRGGRINWMTGCSFIREHRFPVDNDNLLIERLDNQPEQNYQIPYGSLVLTCRQSETHLLFMMDWDYSFWQIGGSTLQTRYLKILYTLAQIPKINLQNE